MDSDYSDWHYIKKHLTQWGYTMTNEPVHKASNLRRTLPVCNRCNKTVWLFSDSYFVFCERVAENIALGNPVVDHSGTECDIYYVIKILTEAHYHVLNTAKQIIVGKHYGTADTYNKCPALDCRYLPPNRKSNLIYFSSVGLTTDCTRENIIAKVEARFSKRDGVRR